MDTYDNTQRDSGSLMIKRSSVDSGSMAKIDSAVHSSGINIRSRQPKLPKMSSVVDRKLPRIYEGRRASVMSSYAHEITPVPANHKFTPLLNN